MYVCINVLYSVRVYTVDHVCVHVWMCGCVDVWMCGCGTCTPVVGVWGVCVHVVHVVGVWDSGIYSIYSRGQ